MAKPVENIPFARLAISRRTPFAAGIVAEAKFARLRTINTEVPLAQSKRFHACAMVRAISVGEEGFAGLPVKVHLSQGDAEARTPVSAGRLNHTPVVIEIDDVVAQQYPSQYQPSEGDQTVRRR